MCPAEPLTTQYVESGLKGGIFEKEKYKSKFS